MTAVRAWFPTLIYNAPLLSRGGVAFNRELRREAQQLRDFDGAGRDWSATGYPGGYTSYGSIDRLHRFSSTFDLLRRRVDRHVRAYAEALGWALQERPLVMSDCWLNIMPRGCAHSFHLHPLCVVSGTYYVEVPKGAPGIKFEDPRLSSLMAAPPRRPDADPALQPHVHYPVRAGQVILFESWLRHEVPTNPVEAERISVSFNYRWD